MASKNQINIESLGGHKVTYNQQTGDPTRREILFSLTFLIPFTNNLTIRSVKFRFSMSSTISMIFMNLRSIPIEVLGPKAKPVEYTSRH
jgi:hypothetical protein